MGTPQWPECRLGVPLGEPERAFGSGGHRLQEWSARRPGDVGQLGSSGTRGVEVAGRDRNVDVRIEQGRPGRLDWRLVEGSPDRRGGSVQPPLGEPEEGQARFRSPTALRRLAKGCLRAGELAAQSVELGLPVDGFADRLVARHRQLLERSASLLAGILPGAVQLHELGPIEQALSAKRHEVRLPLAPSREGRCPFLRPPKVEDLVACLDHGAIGDPDDHRRDLVCGHGDHRLVEQGDTAFGVGQPDEGVAASESCDRGEIRVVESVRDLGGLGKGRAGRLWVTGIEALERSGHQQVATFDAIVLALLEQSRRPRQPSAGAGDLALVEQPEAEPESVSSGSDGLAEAERLVVGAREEFCHIVVSAQQVGRLRQALEVREFEQSVAIGRRQ